MRFELVILIATGLVIGNIYTEGKYIKYAMSKKKYLQMGGVGFAGLLVLYLFKRNPAHAKEIVNASNEYFKYLPIDKNTSDMISPILDFTSKNNFANDPNYNQQIVGMSNEQRQAERIKQSGKKGVKRSKKGQKGVKHGKKG